MTAISAEKDGSSQLGASRLGELKSQCQQGFRLLVHRSRIADGGQSPRCEMRCIGQGSFHISCAQKWIGGHEIVSGIRRKMSSMPVQLTGALASHFRSLSSSFAVLIRWFKRPRFSGRLP